MKKQYSWKKDSWISNSLDIDKIGDEIDKIEGTYGVVTAEKVVEKADSLEQLINLGGFGCGIGCWRVEKGGQFGMFHVA